MAPDFAPRRTGARKWLFAATLTGTIAVTLGAGLSVAPSAAHTATAMATVSSPVQNGLTAYSRPHVSAMARPLTTPAATAVPAPVATAAPAPPAPPAPAAHRVSRPVVRAVAPPRPAAPRAPAPPVSYHSRLISADGSLNTFVSYYGDCSGRTALTHSSAAIDTCVGGRTYFVGHNPGVFTPLFHMGVGSIITYYDGGGGVHRLRIIGVRTWYRASGVPPLLGGAVAEFQACISADGSVDRIMDAAPA